MNNVSMAGLASSSLYGIPREEGLNIIIGYKEKDETLISKSQNTWIGRWSSGLFRSCARYKIIGIGYNITSRPRKNIGDNVIAIAQMIVAITV